MILQLWWISAQSTSPVTLSITSSLTKLLGFPCRQTRLHTNGPHSRTSSPPQGSPRKNGWFQKLRFVTQTSKCIKNPRVIGRYFIFGIHVFMSLRLSPCPWCEGRLAAAPGRWLRQGLSPPWIPRECRWWEICSAWHELTTSAFRGSTGENEPNMKLRPSNTPREQSFSVLIIHIPRHCSWSRDRTSGLTMIFPVFSGASFTFIVRAKARVL